MSRSYIALFFSCLTFSNPFYFMEDILYGTNDPKKDFGIYEIAIGPGAHDFLLWHKYIHEIFFIQKKTTWSSLSDLLTTISFPVADQELPLLIIEDNKFEYFKNEVKKIKRIDGYFTDHDFLYLDASNYIDSAPQKLTIP